PQPAVEELAGPARGASGEVTRLDQRDSQPARHSVQRRAGTDDPATDHHDIEVLRAEPVPSLAPRLRTQSTAGLAGPGLHAHVDHASSPALPDGLGTRRSDSANRRTHDSRYPLTRAGAALIGHPASTVRSDSAVG